MRSTLFDRKTFAERLGGDPDLQREIIAMFVEVQPRQLNDLAQAVAADDPVRSRACAHRLAGAFRNMAMERLGEAAKGLERAAAAGDLERMRTTFLELDELFARVLGELEASEGAGRIGVEILPAAATH
jgi:HPt (histidine-containing phosphotransfer) domain-containing protein